MLIHSSWADNVVAKRSYGDRVIAVRLLREGVRLSVSSCYMPHAGYPANALDDACECLATAAEWASSFSPCYAIGGDFNTQLNTGTRAEKLWRFTGCFNLQIANDGGGFSLEEAYTFISSLGVKRQIDFVLHGPGFHVLHASAVDSLDLGSDHRAVEAVLVQRAAP